MHPGWQVSWHLPIVQNCSTTMGVGSMLHMCHIWVEQVGLDYPEMCCPLCLMWPPQMALIQQAHCLQMVLELRFLYAQPLPHGCICPSACSKLGLMGSKWFLCRCLAAPLSIPQAYHIDWYIGVGPPFHHIFPIFPLVFYSYDNPWRQLHGLGPCPQPPRLLPCFALVIFSV